MKKSALIDGQDLITEDIMISHLVCFSVQIKLLTSNIIIPMVIMLWNDKLVDYESVLTVK